MSAIDPTIMDGYRPVVRGHRHMAVAGHYLAAQAALKYWKRAEMPSMLASQAASFLVWCTANM